MNDGQASDHHPRGSFGFPRWLQVTPAAGIIRPGQIIEVSVRHEEFFTLQEFVDGVPQNWWCEDTRDKEVILVVSVRGSCSIGTKKPPGACPSLFFIQDRTHGFKIPQFEKSPNQCPRACRCPTPQWFL